MEGEKTNNIQQQKQEKQEKRTTLQIFMILKTFKICI